MEIVGINDNRIVLRNAFDAQKLRGRQTITIRGPWGAKRIGILHVRSIEEAEGVVVVEESVRSAIPTACVGDTVVAREDDGAEPEDHAALVAYLLAMVRRRDWRAVSNAANDLREMEASRR